MIASETWTAAAAPIPDDASEAGDDPRVIRALEAYLAEAADGRPPDRRAFLKRHADIAPVLSACLAGLALMESAARGLDVEGTWSGGGRPTPARPEPEEDGVPGPATRLGEFQILREVGRGGMGVVYEAVQTSLGRRVALKVLPLAAALDARQRQRFHLEAQAAAQLHHPNIVPVFAVGCDRGVDYYVMPFVEGRNLAEVIRAHREAAADPPSRGREFFLWAARMGLQAAEALDHAHALGVVHRDIKPANLLIDGRGDLFVADFGLAHVPCEDSLTRTGDLVGTLRYMSPEQALARRAVLDGRSDLYSLGATLYELLTNRPAVEGRDRQDVLRRIAQEEPRPPRRLDRSIPRDLETIVLRAMAKDPDGRYATAREMADDLRRFLAGEPIRARRPSLRDRAAAWARRHRTMVVSGVTLAALAAGGLAVATVTIARERDAYRAASDRARNRFARVDAFYHELVERCLVMEPRGVELHRDLLTRALSYYEEFAREAVDDPRDRLEAARAARLAGEIHQKLGHPERTVAAYLRGIRLLETAGFPAQADAVQADRLLARLHGGVGSMLQLDTQNEEAEARFRRAIAVQGRAVARDPDPALRLELSRWHFKLGGLMADSGRKAAAEALLGRALALSQAVVGPKGEEAAAFAAVIRAQLSETRGRSREAAEAGALALERLERLRAARPHRPDLRAQLATQYFRMALLCSASDDPAVRDPARAVALAEAAVALEPHNAQYQVCFGGLLYEFGREPEAVRVLDAVLHDAPDSPDALNTLAWVLSNSDDPAVRDPARAVALAERAVLAAPGVGSYWNTLGVARYRIGDWSGALEALGRSMALRDGGDGYDWFFIAMIRCRLGEEALARDYCARAARWAERSCPAGRSRELRRYRAEAEGLLASRLDSSGVVLFTETPPSPPSG